MSIAPDAALPGKLEHEIRLGFIRKVYGILSVQLLLTAGFVALTTTAQDVQDFFVDNFWIVFIALAVALVCMTVLLCFRERCARRVPINYLLLFTFTFAEAVIVSYVCAAYDPITILIAAGLSLGIAGILTAYAVLTRRDFSTKVAISLVLLYAAILFGILMGCFYNTRPVQIVCARQAVCIALTIAFGIFLVIDTQRIVGKGRWALSMEDYVVGALIIYVDLIAIFIEMVKLVGIFRASG